MAGNKIIALDLGGTHLRAALVKGKKILKYIKIRTPKSKKQTLEKIVYLISSFMEKDVKGIGVGAPGPLKQGFIVNPPNFPVKNFNLKKFLEKKFKKRVEVENDANCVALAELNFGCKKRNFIVLTLGTGIGGGIIIDGKLYRGKGYGGELGHIILDKKTDFENLAASKAIKKLSFKYFKKELKIKELMRINNEKSKKIINEIADYLGQGIASLINIFDPEIIVLSGGIREGGSSLLRLIERYAKKYTVIPTKIKIRWSKLKHPGIIGASLLVK